MLINLVDAHENRDADIADVPGAFLNAKIDEFSSLNMVNDQGDMMCRIGEKCTEFLCAEVGKIVMSCVK